VVHAWDCVWSLVSPDFGRLADNEIVYIIVIVIEVLCFSLTALKNMLYIWRKIDALIVIILLFVVIPLIIEINVVQTGFVIK
jgi:hypothetical protein